MKPARVHWLVDELVDLMPLEKSKKDGYYDVGTEGQPRGYFQDAAKKLKSLEKSLKEVKAVAKKLTKKGHLQDSNCSCLIQHRFNHFSRHKI